MSLIPCGGCGRHVMNAEPACPFCGAAIDSTVPVPGTPKRRLNRAATFAFGAAVAAATATGCGESHTGTDAEVTEDAGVEPEEDAGSPAPPYGAPAEDAGGIAPAYGAPIGDAGGPAPLYGGAPGD